MVMEEWIATSDEGDVEIMARKPSAARALVNEERVERYVSMLTEVGTDRTAFDVALAALLADADATVADAIEIAVRYRGGGVRPTSRKAAVEVISKRFLEIIRSRNQIAQASKARPW